jgi:PQQ-dependent dehydrogenase (s-GDH family)
VFNLIRAQELPTQTEVTARDWSKYVGKILRLELDGSIPADNPVLQGVRSHVFSYGHRNAQGIVFGPDGKLYSDEQGPKTDDELNWIRAGKNYGWPRVAGYRDDRAYVYGNWSASAPTPCRDLEFSDFAIPESVPIQTESSFSHPDFAPPLRTFYTVENGFDFQDPACAPSYYICWPTIAPSSLDAY